MLKLSLNGVICPALDLSYEKFQKMDHLRVVGYLERHSVETLVSIGGWPALVKTVSWIGAESPDFLTLEELTNKYVAGVLSLAPNDVTAAKILDVDPCTLYRWRKRHGQEKEARRAL